ncbi:MAG: hypothetical protein Q9213_002297 [Squamulea squamosa]
MAGVAAKATGQGIKVTIAAAGGAAFLPGMIAAHTLVPGIVMPVEATDLVGSNILLSEVQLVIGDVTLTEMTVDFFWKDRRRPIFYSSVLALARILIKILRLPAIGRRTSDARIRNIRAERTNVLSTSVQTSRTFKILWCTSLFIITKLLTSLLILTTILPAGLSFPIFTASTTAHPSEVERHVPNAGANNPWAIRGKGDLPQIRGKGTFLEAGGKRLAREKGTFLKVHGKETRRGLGGKRLAQEMGIFPKKHGKEMRRGLGGK